MLQLLHHVHRHAVATAMRTSASGAAVLLQSAGTCKPPQRIHVTYRNNSPTVSTAAAGAAHARESEPLVGRT